MKTIFVTLVMLLPTLFYSCNRNMEMKRDNILLKKFETPHQVVPFDKIELENYLPAIEASINEAKMEINKIIDNPQEPDFKNTIEALEYSGEKLNRINNVFFSLNSAYTSNEMQKLAQKISPMVTEFSNDIYLNEQLFQKVKTVYNAKDNYELTTEQKTLLEKNYKNFIRQGANLNDENKKKLREITTELSKLTLKFGENVLTETNSYELHITDEKDLSGLPDDVIEAAAQTAEAKDKDGWVFTLHYPSYVPFMQYSDNRKLREEIYKAFNSKGFHGNEYDNTQIIKKIVDLRLQLANILGYKTCADYVLEMRMAETPDRVNQFLDEVLAASLPFAKKEFNEVQKYAISQGADFKLQRWDMAYYAEKLKKQKYDVNDEMTRPYFKLENVQKGILGLANTLYGISFKENPEIPVYHPGVKVFEVFDQDGKFLAVLYMDFFPRESKRGGAWATSFRDQYKIGDKDVRPHVSLVFNFTKPTKNKPSLLTYEQVTTFLHEFGHALHYMLSECTYSSLSGTNVYRDFVELPSQIMENYAREKQWLANVALHYETGEKMPDELLQNIINSSNFLSGYSFVRQLSYGMNDMAWHTVSSSVELPVDEFEKNAIASTELFPSVSGCMISTHFSHIFSGGYTAGYYSYKWAEVLDADAFSVFKKNGIFDKATARSFRENILSKGGTEHPMYLYIKFRGQEPTIDALLERSGLVNNNDI